MPEDGPREQQANLAKPDTLELLGVPATCNPSLIHLTEPVQAELGSLLTTIALLDRQVHEMDRVIVATFSALPMPAHPLATIPGMAPLWIAGIWAEIGSITRFANEEALLRYAGLAGTVRHPTALTGATRPTKAFNPFLRVYFLEAASGVMAETLAFRQIYRRARDQGAAHEQALEQVACRLAREVDRLLREEATLAAFHRVDVLPSRRGGLS